MISIDTVLSNCIVYYTRRQKDAF